ncbi:hypothetical protein NQ318_013618 [Aromia moschata]|uniref:Uncharacterized protein n=1 Tax=Aromia moschata TaxID=1265417 RepID=A0AAV8YM40_9CUCU|nr:hypothetical protein NQ318_013618 [Aromia moschata]
MLNYFQQNVSTLTPTQQNLMQQLQHQYRLVQQNQQQLRNSQRLGLNPPMGRSAPTPPAYNPPFGQNGSLLLLPTIGADKLVQPNPIVGPRDFMSPVAHHGADIDDNLEKDLKDFTFTKDLATTLAENLLKHFGSDDIDVKEEADSANANVPQNTLSSGPFSPFEYRFETRSTAGTKKKSQVSHPRQHTNYKSRTPLGL